jgi:Cys-rich four helix bundle protein (predicted Tat secretion target)
MLDRRQLMMTGASALAALSAAGPALAQAPAAGEKTTQTSIVPAKNQPLVDSASECIKLGETCLQHCYKTLAAGDKSMARCAETVRAMLPMCEALESLAIQDSPHLRDLAALCGKVCRDCEKACKVHQNHHEICRQCMQSCAKCAEACEKFIA